MNLTTCQGKNKKKFKFLMTQIEVDIFSQRETTNQGFKRFSLL